ncbi:hypothetical protein HAX54_037158 [Datura stramonium]|uniref:Uncharacterized protein n=1 Tax=Datura stramonium TaxID=4076 RepID=A0ABS8VJ60_DATST|nr:hypothetical protein [Datura stramonium]
MANRQAIETVDRSFRDILDAHPKDAQYRTKKLPDYNTLALIFGDTAVDGRNGYEINDAEDFQNEFSDNDITGERVTTLAYEDTQFVDYDHACFDHNINFTRTKVTQSSSQDKRAGMGRLVEKPTLTSRPKRIRNSIGNS